MKGKTLLLTWLILILFMSSFQVLTVFSQDSQDFPVTVTDDAGRTVTIQSVPQRIVSLAPSNTEILFALGLDDRVVGVTKWCDYPPKVKELVEEGSLAVVDVLPVKPEQIVALNPDLILLYTTADLENLKDLNIPILVLDPKTIDDIYNDILIVGKATGTYEKAELLVNQMKKKINDIKESVSPLRKVKVAYMCWLQPIWVAGGGTFADSAIKIAGGINVFSSDISGWGVVSPEAVIEKNPDIIIYTSAGLQVSGEEIRYEIKQTFAPTNAAKNDEVYLLIGDASSMLERPGPGIFDGIDVLAKIFHPPVYGETPKIITERKVTIKIVEPAGYTEVQVKIISEAEKVLITEGDVKKAYNKLVEAGVISSDVPPIREDSSIYTSLIMLYGPRLEKYPSVEGRIQLLYAMGILKV